MQFKPFKEIRQQELATGHDLILGSCLNLASGIGVDDGEAMYYGRNDEESVVLFIDIDKYFSVISQSGAVLATGTDLEDYVGFLAQYEWAVAE